jgi:hypothetical protein
MLDRGVKCVVRLALAMATLALGGCAVPGGDGDAGSTSVERVQGDAGGSAVIEPEPVPSDGSVRPHEGTPNGASFLMPADSGDEAALASLDVPAIFSGDPTPTTTVERFPTFDAPPSVTSGQEFEARFALTLFQETTGVDLIDGAFSDLGELIMELGLGDSWDLDVVLMAPGFEALDGAPAQTMRLARELDSQRLTFRLRAPTVDKPSKRRLLATLWHAGKYQGKVARTIQVLPPGGAPTVIAEGDPRPIQPPPPGPIGPLVLEAEPVGTPDLTVIVIRMPDDEFGYSIVVKGSDGSVRTGHFQLGRSARARLLRGYDTLAAAGSRGARRASRPDHDERVAAALGFGEEIWEFAPAEFKEAYWEATERLGDDFDTLHVYTEDPLLPWELMLPVRSDRTGGPYRFLGTELLVARWPLSGTRGQLAIPPNHLAVREIVAVAPKYEGEADLTWQSYELAAMESLPGYRRMGGKIEAFRELVKSPPAGIVHFAGHGRSDEGGDAGSEFSIQLEDGLSVSLLTWKGYNLASYDAHPLYFFNACELGQAESVAGFVDGWAPAVLGHGASGFIGALWPVGDRGASDFAVAFYEGLGKELETRPSANVGAAVRDARALFYRTGDPTFLAYVYYGAPQLQLSMLPSGSTPGSP